MTSDRALEWATDYIDSQIAIMLKHGHGVVWSERQRSIEKCAAWTRRIDRLRSAHRNQREREA